MDKFRWDTSTGPVTQHNEITLNSAYLNHLGIIKQFSSKSHEMTLSDLRFICLTSWLKLRLGDDIKISLISGDASFRRYFRVNVSNKTLIAVDSPPTLCPITPFIALDNTFSEKGINVPQVLDFDEDNGLMLLEDLGDCQLGQCLNHQNVESWYQKALDLLPSIAMISDTKLGALPVYDREFVQRELDIFIDWLLVVHLGMDKTALPLGTLHKINDYLIDNVLAQPRGGMHRDFHSRNIMIKDDQLFVIDFQDAVQGPVTYDAVSLLRDCYVRWDDELVDRLSKYHFNLLQTKGLLGNDIQFETYQTWFDLMGLQRHLKAAGIFARLHHRDSKSGYLKDIPLTLEYIRDIARRYPELSEFGDWIDHQVIPEVKTKTMQMRVKR